MAKLGIVAAARLAGVSRHTLWRKAKAGVLSIETTPTGARVIDTAELGRVFGAARHGAHQQTQHAAPARNTPNTALDLHRDNERLHTEVERLRAELEAERTERRALAERADAERARLLALLERRLLPAPEGPRRRADRAVADRDVDEGADDRPRRRRAAPTPDQPTPTLGDVVLGWLAPRRR